MSVRLREFREDKNLTQKEMAHRIGTSVSMYEKVERGYIRASRNFIDKSKQSFPEIDIEEFFFNKNSILMLLREKEYDSSPY